jgi:hypothetical protein
MAQSAFASCAVCTSIGGLTNCVYRIRASPTGRRKSDAESGRTRPFALSRGEENGRFLPAFICVRDASSGPTHKYFYLIFFFLFNNHR